MARKTFGANDLVQVLAEDDGLGCAFVDAAGRLLDAHDWAQLAGEEPFGHLTFDSRDVRPRTLYVCKGAAFKPEYLRGAVEAGAVAYLSEEVYPEAGVPGIVARDVRRAMALVACAFYGDPSRDLAVVGVTGTKGKTTVTFYLESILRCSNLAPTALVGGVFTDDGTGRVASRNTTPESVELQRHLANAVAAGRRSVAMEVSSQGLKYDRTLGTWFSVAVFTNFGEDHISPVEHPTLEDYFASKLKIFAQCSCAVVNLDDERSSQVVDAASRAPRLLTYSMDPASGADVRLTRCERRSEGLWALEVQTPRGCVGCDFCALGAFNVSNALAAVAAAVALGVDAASIARGLGRVRVPGRMERYDSSDGSLVGIVDYAHNEMSMDAVLGCVREEFPGRELTVVFGSTGERAVQRRAGLGRAAGRWADRIILTEDDPGSVPVAHIAAQIGVGVHEQGRTYEVIEDRAQAIHAAVGAARRPAVVVLAGKGVEDTIQRAEGTVPCKPDAQLLCEELGIEFAGYEVLMQGAQVCA